jgi:ATP-binding cassette subfamily B protein/subfamily B ATP-binding cassette protein MsbA
MSDEGTKTEKRGPGADAAPASPLTTHHSPLTSTTKVRRVLHYLKPYRGLALWSVALVVAGSLAGLLVPWPLQVLIDNVLGGEPLRPGLAWVLGPLGGSRRGMLCFAVVAGVVVVLIQHGLTVLDNYVNTRIELGMTLNFRADLFRHAQRLSLAFHDERRSGMLIYAINAQADSVARLVMAAPALAQSVLTMAGMLCVVMMINWQLAVLSLAVVPFLYWSVGYYMRRIEGRLHEVRGMEGESLSIIHEAIAMLRVIVAFGREDHEQRRFREQGEKTVDARVQLTVRQTLFSLGVNLITALGTALVLGVGAYQALEGRLTAGQLLVVLSYIAMVYKPLETVSTTLGTLQAQVVALKASLALLDTEPEIRDAPGAVAVGRSRGEVRFEGVGFHYRGRVDTLKDISFEAREGQVVAVVGPTGAGKSTLVSLIPRFYDVKAGRVLLDGRDVRGLTVRSLREQVSIVLQEPLLFSGTIAENIRYGRLEATMDEVVEAARSANAHDFIARLPKGYDTELGERGAKLSGGERQRIAVARAFLKDAPILILDEPTSSIDSRTESVILDALDRLMVGRTTFLIAHRLSTIRRADRILVIDRGRLVEQGPHEELLRREGLYRQLHDMQTQGSGVRSQESGGRGQESGDLAGRAWSLAAAQENGSDGVTRDS